MIRKKIRYAVVCLLLGALAILYNEYITLLLFFVAVIYPFILWILMEYVKRNVDIKLIAASTIVKKQESFPFEIQLVNRTIIPVLKIQICLAYQNQYTKRVQKENVYAALNARNSQSIEAEMKSEYCGNVILSIEKVFLYDLLGIFRLRKKSGETVMITVLPKQYAFDRIFVPDNPRVMVEGDAYSDRKPGDDSSEIFGIREYRYGDRMNRIHWKLTQKEGTLMVKELGLPLNCAVLLLVELPDKTELESLLRSLDIICSAVFALSCILIENEIDHDIAWMDPDAGSIRRNKVEKEEDLYEVMGMLFAVRISSSNQNVPAHYQAEYPREQYTSIYYITAGLTEEKADSLVALSKNAWCHIIKAGKIEESLVKYVECLPVTIAQIREENLEEDILKMMPQQEEDMQL